MINKGFKRIFVTIGLVFFMSIIHFATCSAHASVYTFAKDTIQTSPADSLKNDSTANKVKNKKPEIDDPVNYSASDSLYYDLEDKKVFLFGDAKVTYQNIELNASYIEFNMGDQTVYASGLPDTAGNLKGKPKFKEGTEEFDAQWLRYNFKTRKGFVYIVKTKQEGGTLIGDTTKREPNGNINLKGAKYSTCDLDHPHFYIGLTKAKSVPNDKIISGPAYFVAADIPLPLILPFGFFPNTKSYASGILIPTWGEEPNRGFFLRNGGYYWGISDYMDARVTADIFSKGTWGANLQTNYKVRYKFSGSMMFNYYYNVTGEKGLPDDYATSRDFRFGWNHSQDSKASPNSTFSASVNLSSSSFDKRNSYDATSYLMNTKSSSISYSHRWPNSPFNFTGSLNHSQNSRTKDVSLTLPQMSLSMNTVYPFRRKEAVGEPRWYENIQFSYNSSLENRINTTDSLFLTNKMFKNMRNGYQHNIPVSVNFKLSRFINLTPSLQYKGVLYTESVEYKWDSTYVNSEGEKVGKVDTIVSHGLKYGQSYYPSISLGYNPKLYGMYLFRNSKIKAVRHVMSPYSSIGFTPDVSNYVPNYYHSYTRSDGRVIQYSEFDRGIYGSPSLPPGKSASISFGLRNNFEMKYTATTDSTSKEEKIPLLENLDFNGSYNLMADSFNLSNIGMNTGTRLFGDKLNVRLNATFDPYYYNSQAKRTKYYSFSKTKQLAMITNASLSFGTSFKSSEGKEKTKSNTANTNLDNTGNINTRTGNPDEDFVSDEVNYDIPWSVSVDYQWNYNKTARYDNATKKNKLQSMITQSVSFTGDLSVTKKWKIGFRSGYDFESKEMTFTTINISRDLHCWEMRFSWVPFGYRTSYNFTINARASLLKDLKYTKHSDWRDNF